ncbi:MAG: vWA domain-containing protein [Bacteroidota bacterium]
MEDKGNSNLPVHNPNKEGALNKFESFQGKLKHLKTSLKNNEVVPRIYNQLIIFVLDASRSMESLSKKGIPKAQDIHDNVQLVLKRLRESKNKTSFDIGMIAFSDESLNVFGIKELKEISENQSFNSVKLLKKLGGTKFLPALEEAEKMIDQYFSSIENDLPRNALILMMTDGEMDDYSESLKKVEDLKLKEHITISVMYLDSLVEDESEWHSWNEETGEVDYSNPWTIERVKDWKNKQTEKLIHFATNDSFYMTTMDAEGVRNHMIKSISDTSHLI